jgi:hypothetical protein
MRGDLKSLHIMQRFFNTISYGVMSMSGMPFRHARLYNAEE